MTVLSRGIGGAAMLALTLTLGLLALGTATAEAAPQYTYGCDFCHTMPPRDSGTAKKDPFTGGVPGNHLGHSSNNKSSCVPCHGDQSGYTNAHRNKVIELEDSLNYERKQPGAFLNQTSVPPNPLGTCSNVACHSDGKVGFRRTAAWGSPVADMNCSSCHDAAPDTGSHFVKHAAYFGNSDGSCVKCHSDHSVEAKPFAHATSAASASKRGIDVRFSAAPNNGGGLFQNGSCSDIYCHSDGRGNKKPVSWAKGTTLDCSGCHGNAFSSAGDALSGAHGKHVNNLNRLGANYACADCHAGIVSNDTTISDLSKHVDGRIDTAGGANLGSVSAGSCSTSYCHSNGKGTFQPVTWTQTESKGCSACHGTTNATGAPDYVSGNSHAKHGSVCADCHSKTTLTGTSIVAGGQHIDGFNNFTSGNGKSFGKLPNATCSNISCHSGNGVVQNVANAQWGTTLDCSGCHSTLTPAHSAHTGLYGCVDCHATVVSSNTVISTPANHLNNQADVAGNTLTSFTRADHSCATSCHMSGAPKWNVAASGQCGTCHAVTGIATGGHAAHFTAAYGPQMTQDVNSCQVCHVYNGETVAPHGTGGNADMQAGYPVNGACSACHKQNSTQWYVKDSVTCDSCHSTAGGELSVIANMTAPKIDQSVSNGHGKAGINKSCADCHDKNSAHINGVPGDKRLLAGLGSGNDNTECNYCHADAGKVSPLNLNIKTHRASGSGYLCSDCHDVHGAAPNTMMVKRTIDGTTVSFNGNNTFANEARTGVCQVCHVSTSYFTKAGRPQTTHVDSTVNCLDCHSHNPTDGSMAFSASGACDACHGYPPAPRQTLSAVTFGVQGNWSSAKFESYSGGGGAHLVEGHVPKNLRLTGTPADWTPCLPCHYDAAAAHAKTLPIRNFVQNVSVTMDPQFRFSPDYYMAYSSAKFVSGGANKTGTCFNTSCHMAPSKPWSIER